MTKYISYSDPGHGWLKVRISELQKLGIADKISAYSYQRGKYAYLEEDCDAPLLIDAKKKKGQKVEFIDKTTDKSSKIRNYQHYQLWVGY